MSEPVIFVWVEALRGPSPQIWYRPQFRDGKPHPTLARHALKPDELGLDLAILAKIYPPPAEKEST